MKTKEQARADVEKLLEATLHSVETLCKSTRDTTNGTALDRIGLLCGTLELITDKVGGAIARNLMVLGVDELSVFAGDRNKERRELIQTVLDAVKREQVIKEN